MIPQNIFDIKTAGYIEALNANWHYPTVSSPIIRFFRKGLDIAFVDKGKVVYRGSLI